MKKIFSILLTLVITNTLWAYDFQSGGLYYNITSDSAPYTVAVTSPKDPDKYTITSVSIPKTVTYKSITYNVTAILGQAFSHSYALQSITIPSSVNSIGDWAFFNCKSLTSITIPNSVTSLGELAFYGCTSLISATIGDSVTSIENETFYGCTSLSSVSIGNSVTSIGKNAFYDCSSLQNITIGNSVKSIGEWAFFSCINLNSIAIPNSVETIHSYAFLNCSNLETIYMGTRLQSIGANAFSTLKEITIRATTPPIIEYSTFPTNMSITAKIPNGSLGKYQEATYWSNFNLEGLGSDNEPREITCIEAVAIGSTLEPNTYTEESYIVTGYVTKTDGVVSEGQQRFWMADTQNGGKVFHSYWGNVSEVVFVGDKVSLTGQIMEYNSTYQIKNGDVFILSYGNSLQTYTVSVSSANTSIGTVSGGGTYEEGSTVTVTATPKSGYKFTKWSDGTTKNPYTFTVTKDISLIAYFEKESSSGTYEITCEEAAEIAASLPHNTPTAETYTVIGYVTETDGVISREQQRFWMADTPNGGNVFQSYWGNVTEAVSVGDKVSLKGQIMRYNSTYQIKNGDVVLLQPKAQNVFWNFSNAEFNSLGTISSTQTVDGLTINATSSGTVMVDASSQTIDNISFTHRLKLNGTGSANYRSLKFNVTGDCTIDIYLKSANSSENRTLRIDFGTFNSNNYQKTSATASIAKSTISYTGEATTVYVYGTVGGVNLYGIRVNYNSSTNPDDPKEITCEEAAEIAAGLEHNTPTEETYTVIGYVTATDGVISREQQRFWMADNLNDGNVFQCYWGNVTVAVKVGDKVSLTGQIMRYYSTYQIQNGDVELLSRENKPKIYTVTVSSDNTSMGTVSGGGEYEEGTSVTVTAIPKNGCTFFAWNDCSTMNPYTFTVTEDIDLIAYFDFDSSIEQISCEEAAEIAASLPHNTPTNETYTVIGYVTETDGVVSRNQQKFWMADYPDDENVFQCYWGNVTEVMNIGDKVAITGQIMRYNSTYQIKNGDVVRLSSEEVISCEEAVEFVNTFLQNNATTAAIYNVVGYVTETDGVISRGQQRFWMADTPNGGKVFQSYWGNVSEIIQVGDYVSVRGHLMRYNSTAQIKNGDVTVLSQGTGVDDVVIHKTFDKILRDGQLLILRDGKTYTVMGQEL